MKNQLIILSIVSLFFLASCQKKEEGVAPQRKDITEMVFASGVLEPDAKYNLTAQSDGYLLRLDINEGDIIKAGQVLAVIDNPASGINLSTANKQLKIAQINTTDNAPALKQIAANIGIAKERLTQDETQAARYQKLWESSSVSKVEYENMRLAVENTKAQIKSLEAQYAALQQQAEQQLIAQQSAVEVNSVATSNNAITAIVGGKVYKKLKQKGDYVRRGEVIAVIGNADYIYARINIDESNIAKVKVGQTAHITLNPQKGTIYKGKVYEILPAFDEMTQSFICKVQFVDSLQFNVSGTQLEANIEVGEKKNALLIPRRLMGYGNKVQLAANDSVITIGTGIISTEWVEVTEGLTEKDLLVTIKPKKK